MIFQGRYLKLPVWQKQRWRG